VISGNGGSGTGSYDDRTDSKTYTVASLGACWLALMFGQNFRDCDVLLLFLYF
jgi:hypothetical protein